MKIDMNQRYLIQINDMENRDLASMLPLNCLKIAVFEPLTHPIIPKLHAKVTLLFGHQFPLNLSNYTFFSWLNSQFN